MFSGEGTFLFITTLFVLVVMSCFFQHSHTPLGSLGSVKAIMVIGSEMIFCSHSAKEIGMDVIHLGCSPCCKYLILL